MGLYWVCYCISRCLPFIFGTCCFGYTNFLHLSRRRLELCELQDEVQILTKQKCYVIFVGEGGGGGDISHEIVELLVGGNRYSMKLVELRCARVNLDATII